MSAYHAGELLVVGGIVAASVWMLARRFLPKRGGKATGGCSGCDSCGSCDTPKPRSTDEKPVHFHRG